MEVPRAMLERHGLGPERPYLASMGIYMFRKEALIHALANDLVDFGRDIIPAALGRFRVQAHFFTGYWRDIGTIRAFFDAHMDLVSADPPFTFHDPAWPFYTRPRYLPGARLTNCHFNNVILADGTHIDGCAIEDSVIGLRTPMRGARVRRALIMGVDSHYPDAPPTAPPIGIGPGTEIHNAIVDKNPRIGRNVRIVNAHNRREADGDGWAIRDGVVVVAKNSIIPDGTVI
jgi:glucose-1-phosphate adenylyltransferase